MFFSPPSVASVRGRWFAQFVSNLTGDGQRAGMGCGGDLTGPPASGRTPSAAWQGAHLNERLTEKPHNNIHYANITRW